MRMHGVLLLILLKNRKARACGGICLRSVSRAPRHASTVGGGSWCNGLLLFCLADGEGLAGGAVAIIPGRAGAFEATAMLETHPSLEVAVMLSVIAWVRCRRKRRRPRLPGIGVCSKARGLPYLAVAWRVDTYNGGQGRNCSGRTVTLHYRPTRVAHTHAAI